MLQICTAHQLQRKYYLPIEHLHFSFCWKVLTAFGVKIEHTPSSVSFFFFYLEIPTDQSLAHKK